MTKGAYVLGRVPRSHAATVTCQLRSYVGFMDITQLKPGDFVTRLLANTIPVPMRVVRVDDIVVCCTQRDIPSEVALRRGLIWTFDKETGAEIDDDLGWGPAHGVTGSQLLPTAGPLARDHSASTLTRESDGTFHLHFDLPAAAFPVRMTAFVDNEVLWKRTIDLDTAVDIPDVAAEHVGRLRLRLELADGQVIEQPAITPEQ